MKQPVPFKSTVPPETKNFGGKLPAAIGNKTTNHGSMQFKKGGIARKGKK